MTAIDSAVQTFPTTTEELDEWLEGKYWVAVQYGDGFPPGGLGEGVGFACVDSSDPASRSYAGIVIADGSLTLDIISCLERNGFDLQPPVTIPFRISDGGDPESFSTGHNIMIIMRRSELPNDRRVSR